MISVEDVQRHAPGFLGAMSALLWIGETWPRRLGVVAAGTANSVYASSHVAGWLGVEIHLAALLVGLFSVAVADKAFSAVNAFEAAPVIKKLLKKWGLL